ncbi:MAG TPA: hypothetical protein VGQ61_00875 [Candidatus Angelobacter sp.]|nr:hypothetical protein [Candidatus Angelobacter sp.]
MRRSAWLVVLLASLVIISTGCGGGSTPIVTPTPTPAANSVAISFAAPTPVAVAQKIGAGNWMAASLPSSGPLMLQLPPGTTQYGVAFNCTSGTPINRQVVIQADIRDGNAYTLQLCGSDAGLRPTGNLSGSFDATAIAGATRVDISVDNFSTGATSATPTGSFNITTAQVGVTDLFAVAFDSSHTLLAMKIVRSQTVPGVANGGNPITLAASDAIPTTMPISVVNAPAGFNPPGVIHFPSYVTANGSYAIGIGDPFLPTGYSVAPAAQAQPGDYYLLDLSAAIGNRAVSTTHLLKTAAPVTLTLPNPWTATPPTPARFPTFTFDYTGFAGQPAVADFAAISWTQSAGAVFFSMNVISTANNQNGATALAVPDLTSIPGFLPMAPAGTTISWFASTVGGTTQFYAGPTPIPQTVSRVSNQGTYTQP